MLPRARTESAGAASRLDRQTVPLTSDLVFKYVFGAEQSVEILRSLLSAVQEDAGCPEVATVQITNPFNQKDFADDKLSVVDVKATDVTGATYTMEAQATWHKAFASRALYYWARSYGNQLSESEIYSRLQPVRMPSTAFGRWMYYIKDRGKEGAMDDPIMKEILEDTSEIREAEKRYQGFVADAELRDRLEARDKFRRTHLQLLHDAEEKGLEQGLQKGREQGIEQGRKEEREKRRETARRLKAKEMPIAEIAAVTDLPEDEIREL